MDNNLKLTDLIYNWGDYLFKKRDITVFDTTLRDGLQSSQIKKVPSLLEKFSFIQTCSELGIDAIELGFPASCISHKKEVIALAKFIKQQKYPIIPSCLSRTVQTDVEAIVDVSQIAGTEITVNIFVGSSKIRHLVENWNIKEIKKWIKISIETAQKYNLPVEFVTEDTTRTDPETLKTLYTTALNEGVKRIWIADTVGVSVPNLAKNITEFFVKEIINGGKIGLDWHGHNDKNLGTANALAAAESGADRIQATALGIGERAGNTSMESIIINLALSNNKRYNLKKLPEYSKAASLMYGIAISDNYPVVGRLAHSTAAGIHAAAILKANKLKRKDLEGAIYSAFHPEILNSEIEILIGPMSGTANVEWNLNKLGIRKNDTLIKKILFIAKNENRFISIEEVKSICNI